MERLLLVVSLHHPRVSNWNKKKIDKSVNQTVKSIQIYSVNDGTFSFAVSLQLKEVNWTTGEITYKHFCGGILLQYHDCTAYVLSAAHCLAAV